MPLFRGVTSVKPTSTLEGGEQACDIYEAYLTYYPQSTVRLEELMLLKRGLTRRQGIELRLCRECRALILYHRTDRRRRICTHCEDFRQQSEDSLGVTDQSGDALLTASIGS
jgi:hypothetical protein